MGPLRRLLFVATAAAFIAGCSSPARKIANPPSPAATAAALTTMATPALPTITVPTPTPADVELSSHVVTGRAIVLTWQSGSRFVGVNTIVEVRNIGTGWAELRHADYTIYSKSGVVLETRDFIYAFSRYLAPGATGYLADATVSNEWKTGDPGKVGVDGEYSDVAESDAPILATAKIENQKEQYWDGYITTGTVTNTSGEDIDRVDVGAFYLDADGTPLGFSYASLVDNLSPGETKGFKTVVASAPIKGSIAKTVVFASPSL